MKEVEIQRKQIQEMSEGKQDIEQLQKRHQVVEKALQTNQERNRQYMIEKADLQKTIAENEAKMAEMLKKSQVKQEVDEQTMDPRVLDSKRKLEAAIAEHIELLPKTKDEYKEEHDWLVTYEKLICLEEKQKVSTFVAKSRLREKDLQTKLLVLKTTISELESERDDLLKQLVELNKKLDKYEGRKQQPAVIQEVAPTPQPKTEPAIQAVAPMRNDPEVEQPVNQQTVPEETGRRPSNSVSINLQLNV